MKPDENSGKLGSGAASSSSAHAATISALEEDGSFRFFWLDYLEQDGVLYFVGKTLDKKTNSYVSCCVTVTNLQRNLFVLPRAYQLDDDGCETDIVPDMPAVWKDFDQVRKKAGVKGWKAKFVKRKYAFGEPDVPREESQWLKVVYGFEGTLCSFVGALRSLSIRSYFQSPKFLQTSLVQHSLGYSEPTQARSNVSS